MRHFIAFPLSFAAIFAACDSSTSPDSYIKGDQIYERHIDRSQASMKCVVYATDYSVSLDFNFSVLSDETPNRPRRARRLRRTAYWVSQATFPRL